MSNWYADSDSDAQPPVDFRWSSLFSWSLFLGLGLIVWELTDRTGLSLSVACLKFAWDEVATGTWLWSRDPVHSRGWACFAFHFARGCRRAGLIAVCVATLAEQFERQWQPLNQPANMNQDFLINTLLLGLCGVAIWMFVSGVGAVIALSCRLRLWIDPTTRIDRKLRSWPPQPRGKNRVRASTIAGVVNLSHLLGLQMVVLLSPWLLLVTLPLSIGLGWLAANRIAAATPDECWPELNARRLDTVDANYRAAR